MIGDYKKDGVVLLIDGCRMWSQSLLFSIATRLLERWSVVAVQESNKRFTAGATLHYRGYHWNGHRIARVSIVQLRSLGPH